MNLTGAAKTEFEIVDYSAVNAGGTRGIVYVIGITERGVEGKPILVRSWPEYRRYFGGILPLADSYFPLYCYFMLQRNTPLCISPAAHYTDVNDDTTAVGAVAVASVVVGDDSAIFKAKNKGTWANGKVTVTVTAAKSGLLNRIDISVKLAGFPELDQTVTDVKNTPSVQEKAELNAKLKLVDLYGFTGKIPVAVSGAFTDGVRTASLIVTADFVGSSTGQTGIYSFAKVKGGVRIAVPEKADPAIDAALAAFANIRKDIRFHLRTPAGIDGDTAIDYREGDGVYSHNPIDDWRGNMVYGDSAEVRHPDTNQIVTIPALCDYLANRAKVDSSGKPWLSASGPQRGRVPGRKSLVYNLGDATKATELDNVDAHGIYPLIDHETYGPMFWGFNNLWKTPQLIQQDTNSELVLELYRRIKPLIDFQSFEPNNPKMWRKLYLGVKPILEEVGRKEGLASKDENVGWVYFGDQNAETKLEATLNSQDDLDEGKYIVRVFIKPVGATKFIGFQLGLTKSSVNFEEILDNVPAI